jgi:hypothetical protein
VDEPDIPTSDRADYASEFHHWLDYYTLPPSGEDGAEEGGEEENGNQD